MSALPIIDISPLVQGAQASPAARQQVAAQLAQACRDRGFFYIIGHGVSPALQHRLEALSQQFFALPLARKMAIHMSGGGRAWRGYFPVGEELTSGKPDQKEGLYFGAELDAAHPLVQSGTPLHGPNLFPSELPELRSTVLTYLNAMTQLGQQLMQGIALSLELPASYFYDRYTRDPLILFRIFNYPPAPHSADGEQAWGVGEHTDYGVLTILRQDLAGGLEVRSGSRWMDAPPIPDSFVCNLGDMLDRMTGGLYRSTPHRVRNRSGRARLSFPFFFDPSWSAHVQPIALPAALAALVPDGADAANQRWDGANVHAFQGTYGLHLEQSRQGFPGSSALGIVTAEGRCAGAYCRIASIVLQRQPKQ